MDENLLHISYEGGVLEDLKSAPPEDMWLNTKSLEDASEGSEEITIEFLEGDPVAVNDKKLSPANLFRKLNFLGGNHGIGRIDIVESRVTGMKSRGCYETPGGTILLKARRAMESLCLSGKEIKNKDKLIPDYAALIYEGLWWSNKRVNIQNEIDSISKKVNGKVSVKLYKGNITSISKESTNSLYNENKVSFEEEGGFSNEDMKSHIKKNILEFDI
jgi:argininosuccinate synthase